MNVAYALRLKFTAPCEQQIVAQHEALERGQPITIHLPEKTEAADHLVAGYKASLMIIIDPADVMMFRVESPPHRFPARIKASATALRNCGEVGKFSVSHDSGTIEISKA